MGNNNKSVTLDYANKSTLFISLNFKSNSFKSKSNLGLIPANSAPFFDTDVSDDGHHLRHKTSCCIFHRIIFFPIEPVEINVNSIEYRCQAFLFQICGCSIGQLFSRKCQIKKTFQIFGCSITLTVYFFYDIL
jgi:hypothetical protein